MALVTEERTVDVGRGISLCWQGIGDPADPPLLLVMGLGMQLVAWHDDFCAELAGRGFYVVRFDNRDAGHSTSVSAPVPSLRQLATRLFSAQQYTLADMADDTAGLIRELDLDPAHVVGASMGGMVAQTLAARHPGCVRSLTSIMSTTGARRKGQPAMGVYRYLLRQSPTEREAFIEYTERVFRAIGSKGLPTNVEEVRERAARSFDRGINRAGTGRQLGAILSSGDRTDELRGITVPTLVIHGSEDRMIGSSGGQATAEAVPGAELMVIEGMGHDLPRAAWPQIVGAIAEHAQRADRALQPA